ncbi:MAG: hypothetical protein HN509_18315 [Halobacteriovoraceae bacterium]|jgi:hypothetical protein|nr:hypothetical protein [Halobacteriovoraceae bacterium]MBT5093530.1 hypothetical protein [Halobacteriovoraceae bacterium]
MHPLSKIWAVVGIFFFFALVTIPQGNASTHNSVKNPTLKEVRMALWHQGLNPSVSLPPTEMSSGQKAQGAMAIPEELSRVLPDFPVKEL